MLPQGVRCFFKENYIIFQGSRGGSTFYGGGGGGGGGVQLIPGGGGGGNALGFSMQGVQYRGPRPSIPPQDPRVSGLHLQVAWSQ